FNRFYRGKNASKDSIGIGLALSKSIIERQNGTLHAENCHNGGARFIIKFYT
ncbi:TPA: sensor histidine kinase, partial [Clostridioides difficile]|nr:sensor histidine kinase [Clostridioides difficile]